MSNAYAGFGKNSGPGAITLGSPIVFGLNNHPFRSFPIITSTPPPPSSIESHGSSDGQNLGAQPTESIFSFSSIESHGSSGCQNLGAQATESLLFSFGSIKSHGSSDGQNLSAQPTENRLLFSFGSIESHGLSDGRNLGAQLTERPSSVTTFIAPGDSTTGISITAKDEKEMIESSS